MDVIVERCAGLDVGKDEVVACVRSPSPSGKTRRSELRVFLTFTSGLEELADWLTESGVSEVVMEATGQYWKPVWYVLEELRRGCCPGSVSRAGPRPRRRRRQPAASAPGPGAA